jgi:hypothetical protein
MLGFPSSVKYIARKDRPKRYFRKRNDGTLEEYYPKQATLTNQEQILAEARACYWDQDAD